MDPDPGLDQDPDPVQTRQGPHHCFQMSIQAIQYPLTTTLEGNKYPLAKDKRVLQPSHKYLCCCLQNPCDKFARGLPTTYGTFARGLLQLHKKGQPLCNTSEVSKIQI